VKRAFEIGQVVEEDGHEYVDEEKLSSTLNDLLATLRAVGGQFSVAAIRTDAPNRLDAQAMETTGYAIVFDTRVPAVRSSPAPAEPVDEEV
jgi:hypothetical protein